MTDSVASLEMPSKMGLSYMDDAVSLWVERASRDLLVAKYELNRMEGEVITEAVCFHSQQSAEKYLKAFLMYHKHNFEKTHNLELLRATDNCII